jgi:hypothetical protein
MRVIVRGWGDGALIFQEAFEFEKPEDFKVEDMVRHAHEHIELVAKFDKHMIELEFKDDDPDPTIKFIRFGVDESGMTLSVT